jgi:hypothetical protein
VRAADTLKRELQGRRNMPLLTELFDLWRTNYKYVAPTALQISDYLRLPPKIFGVKFFR